MLTKTTVRVDGRRFTVHSNAAGAVIRITERRLHGVGRPWECEYNATYWHHAHCRSDPLNRRNLSCKIIEAAKVAYAAP